MFETSTKLNETKSKGNTMMLEVLITNNSLTLKLLAKRHRLLVKYDRALLHTLLCYHRNMV